jgi:hypothetical protein
MRGPEEPLERGDEVEEIATGIRYTVAETSFLMLRLEGETEWRRMAEFKKVKPPSGSCSRSS